MSYDTFSFTNPKTSTRQWCFEQAMRLIGDTGDVERVIEVTKRIEEYVEDILEKQESKALI